MKPGDEVQKVFETTNKATLLVFDTNRNCYKIKVNDVNETRAGNLGVYLPNMIKENIEVVNYSLLDEKQKILIIAYSNNKVAKINLESFEGNRSILKNSYNQEQELVDMITLTNDTVIKVITSKTVITKDTTVITAVNNRAATGVYVTRKGILQAIEVVL
jgi:DNA gyrase subunit A